jgi:hypothetical protein
MHWTMDSLINCDYWARAVAMGVVGQLLFKRIQSAWLCGTSRVLGIDFLRAYKCTIHPLGKYMSIDVNSHPKTIQCNTAVSWLGCLPPLNQRSKDNKLLALNFESGV